MPALLCGERTNVNMNSPRAAPRTLPPLFRWLFPFQVPVAAVAIYASAYVFGVDSSPFIVPVTAVSSTGPVHPGTAYLAALH